MAIDFLTTELPARHAFFTRNGGVTPGYLGALNCGSRFDTKENIIANQQRAMQALEVPFERLSILTQIHSPKVQVVEATALPRNTEGDAMVSRTPGMALGILTADCTPVLFADRKAGVVGAAHAGWKGALYGVVENTLAAMQQLGANLADIAVAIGPCIRQLSYEVGPEYQAQFVREDAQSAAFFIPSPKAEHWYFDLPGYVVARLKRSGITAIHDTAEDTCSQPERFFSCRRAFLTGEQGFGNGLSVVVA